MTVVSGNNSDRPRRAEAVARKKRPSISSSKKAIRNGTSERTLKSTAPTESSTGSVSSVRRPSILERSSTAVPSNPQAARELNREQASVSRRLTGDRPNSEDLPLSARVALSSTGSSTPSDSENGLFQGLRDGVGGLVDRISGGIEEIADRARTNLEDSRERQAEAQREAEQAYAQFSQDPTALRDQIREDGLGGFSDAERLAISQLAEENSVVGQAASATVRSEIEELENFEQIRTDLGSQRLINQFATEEDQERLGEIVQDHLSSTLERHVQQQHEAGARGDTQADRAVDNLISDAEDIARTHPALAPRLLDDLNSVLESSNDDLTQVRRNDDNWAQRRVHDASGLARATFGGAADGLRHAVRFSGQALDLPQRLGSRAATAAVSFGGDRAANVLDSLGAETLAAGVRSGSEAVSGGIQAASDFSSNITQDVFTGVGEGLGVAVDGLGEVVANPVGTAQGLAQISNAANPFTLPISVIQNGGSITEAVQQRHEVLGGLVEGLSAGVRQTNEEHGAVAATAHAVFDVVTTVGTGGTVAGARGAGLAGRLANLGRRGAGFADELGTAGRLGDDLARVGTRLGDDAAALGGRLGDASPLGRADDLAAGGRGGPRLADDSPNASPAGSRPRDGQPDNVWRPDNDPAAIDPFNPQVRSQVRSPDFHADPGYQNALNRSIDDFAQRPPRSLGEALDNLTSSEIAAWRRGQNPGEPFFAPRGSEGSIFTPVTGRYADATGPWGNFRARVEDLLANRPGVTTSHRAGAGEIAATEFIRNLPGSSSRNPVIIHSSNSSSARFVDLAESAYHRALQPGTSLADTVRAVGEVNWYLAQSTPFGRGSAAAAEVISRGILDARGIRSSAYRPGVVPDLEAFVTPLNTFVNRYQHFFERPPTLG